jgi:hypothetical protein
LRDVELACGLLSCGIMSSVESWSSILRDVI